MSDAGTSPLHEVTAVEFGGLRIAYDDRLLTPRAWTLAQSHWAIELLLDAPDGPVLELCAGAGHIGLAAVVDGSRELVQVDLNPAACAYARHNAAEAGVGSRVEVREGRLEEVLAEGERYAVIIADPPWVPTDGIGQFPEDPTIAIDGGSDGLDLARACCDVVDGHLAEGGSGVLQVGTLEQVGELDRYLSDVLGSSLRVVDTRTYDRGVLARLAR